jgi:hypothetical protein
MNIDGYILTTGRCAAFLLDAGASLVSGRTGNPTISVNGGGALALSGAITSTQFPFVFYPLATPILATDVVTWSAPAGWVTSGASAAASATTAAMTNWVGAEMFPIGAPTMGLGVNQWGPQPFWYTALPKNYRRFAGYFNLGGGVWSGFLQNRGVANGIDNWGSPGVRGVFNVTWDDSSPGRNKLAWLTPANNSTVTPNVGAKQTVFTDPGGAFTRFRQAVNIGLTSHPESHGLPFYLNYHDTYVQNISVTDPFNDPDGPHIASDYFRTACAGSKVVRFMQAGDGGVYSNVSTLAQCHQVSDFGYGAVKALSVKVTQVEPIAGGAITIDGVSYPIVDGRTAFGSSRSGSACGRFTTATPHPFADRQRVVLQSLVNQTYSSSTGQRNGFLVAGTAGNLWAGYGGASIWVYPVDATHFDGVWASDAVSSVAADVAGLQTFDTSGTNSNAFAALNTQGALPYEDQLQVAGELGAVAWLNVGECFSSQACTDLGNALLAKYQALLAVGMEPEFIVLEWSNENWNFNWTSTTVLQVIQRLTGNIGIYKAEADMAAKYLSLVKAPFDAAGLGSVVKRGLFSQWSVPGRANTVWDYCVSKGYTFEVGGDAPYLGILESLPSHACDGLDFEQMHDFMEWVLKYSTAINGANAGARANLLAHYPGALYLGYEAAMDNVLPFGGATNQVARVRDFFYHPRMYRTSMLAYWIMQQQGYDFVCKYNISHGMGFNPNCYSLMNVDGQSAGMGFANVFSATKPASVNQDWANESPALKAYQDWIAGAPSPTPTPTPTPTGPRIPRRRWFPGVSARRAR